MLKPPAPPPLPASWLTFTRGFSAFSPTAAQGPQKHEVQAGHRTSLSLLLLPPQGGLTPFPCSTHGLPPTGDSPSQTVQGGLPWGHKSCSSAGFSLSRPWVCPGADSSVASHPGVAVTEGRTRCRLSRDAFQFFLLRTMVNVGIGDKFSRVLLIYGMIVSYFHLCLTWYIDDIIQPQDQG